MRVVGLKAENVKRITAIDLSTDRSCVVIAGKNGAGKSSAIDSIAYALGGKELIDERPIRSGEDSAFAEVVLSNGFRVRRTWNSEKTNLVVMSADGAKFPSPQKLLDEMLGPLTFDPLELSRMSQADSDYQLFVEVVGDGGDGCITIEDGAVKK